jgi:hypothetical protein
MSVYPRSLSHYLNRLSGYNKNNVKLNVLGSTSASQGDIIQVDLPTNSIVDLSSLAWSLQCSFSEQPEGTAGNAATQQQMALPNNVEAIIDRLEVQINGQSLVNITNYNTLFHALLYTTATDDYQRMRRISQSNVEVGSEERDGLVVTYPGTAAVVRDHVVDSWLGFLGNSKPNFIDTSLLGNVRIQITLNNGDIIGGGATGGHGATGVALAAPLAPTKREFSILQQHFSIDVISISDGIYDSMIDSMLASGKPIEVPFKNYLSYTHTQGDMNINMPFSVSSQSIDRIWAIARDAAYNSSASNSLILAHGGQNQGNMIPYFNYSSRGGTNFEFTVNNTTYPAYNSVEARDWNQQLRNAIGDQGNMLSGCVATSLAQYKDNFFTFAVSLEHHSGADERFVSGIDTRGASANCMFKSQGAGVGGAGDSHQIVVFCEMTSILEIKANKVITVIQ